MELKNNIICLKKAKTAKYENFDFYLLTLNSDVCKLNVDKNYYKIIKVVYCNYELKAMKNVSFYDILKANFNLNLVKKELVEFTNLDELKKIIVVNLKNVNMHIYNLPIYLVVDFDLAVSDYYLQFCIDPEDYKEYWCISPISAKREDIESAEDDAKTELKNIFKISFDNSINEDKYIYQWRQANGLSYNCAQALLYRHDIKPIFDNRKYLPNFNWYYYEWHHINTNKSDFDPNDKHNMLLFEEI